MCKYSNLDLNTFAHSLLLHSGTLAHTYQRAANAMLQRRARESIQVIQVEFSILTQLIAPKVAIFAKKYY